MKRNLISFIFAMAMLMPLVKATADFNSGTVINTSVSNSSITFNTYNITADLLVVEDNNITLSNVTCSNGVFRSQVFHSVPNQVNDSSTFCINILAPNVTSLTENPTDPATYSPGQLYEFNATIQNSTPLFLVKIEFNNVNYTVISSSGNVYNFTISDLAAGTYTYRWFVNDTNGNFNNSESGTYTVNKATGEVNTFLNQTRADISIVPNTSIMLNGSLITGKFGSLNLTIDGSQVNFSSSKNVSYTYDFPAIGTFTVQTDYSGNQNYTSAFESWLVNVANAVVPGNVTSISTTLCRYKKLGYFNTDLMTWFRQVNCV